jgi:pentose-5-phosphate-3-epimerase
LSDEVGTLIEDFTEVVQKIASLDSATKRRVPLLEEIHYYENLIHRIHNFGYVSGLPLKPETTVEFMKLIIQHIYNLIERVNKIV